MCEFNFATGSWTVGISAEHTSSVCYMWKCCSHALLPPWSIILKSVIITNFPSHYNFLSYHICNLAKKIILNHENKITTTRKFRAHEQTIIISSDCFFVIVYFYFVAHTGWQVVNEHRNEKLYLKGFLLQCVYILLLYQDTFLRLTPHID